MKRRQCFMTGYHSMLRQGWPAGRLPEGEHCDQYYEAPHQRLGSERSPPRQSRNSQTCQEGATLGSAPAGRRRERVGGGGAGDGFRLATRSRQVHPAPIRRFSGSGFPDFETVSSCRRVRETREWGSQHVINVKKASQHVGRWYMNMNRYDVAVEYSG